MKKNSIFDLTLPTGTNNTQYEITFKNGTLGLSDIINQRSFIIRQAFVLGRTFILTRRRVRSEDARRIRF
ncbi:MAG: hypothetical protein QMA99_03235, partial [Flavobacterium sp.]